MQTAYRLLVISLECLWQLNQLLKYAGYVTTTTASQLITELANALQRYFPAAY